jgi:dihydroflavonol-4-reductase
VTDPKNDDELVRPARDGTLRVLKAARDAGVKRVVMTSSISAIIYGRGVRERPFTEEDWTDETNRRDTSPYDRAKTLAERAAWGWLAAEGGGVELVTINPGLVLGPVLGSDYSASIEAIKKLLDGSIPAAFRLQRGRCAGQRAPACAGDDDARSRRTAIYRLGRLLLDVRRRQDAQA